MRMGFGMATICWAAFARFGWGALLVMCVVGMIFCLWRMGTVLQSVNTHPIYGITPTDDRQAMNWVVGIALYAIVAIVSVVML